jgi:iron-sulfur cluster repair protein YtfE (RIC family)
VNQTEAIQELEDWKVLLMFNDMKEELRKHLIKEAAIQFHTREIS